MKLKLDRVVISDKQPNKIVKIEHSWNYERYISGICLTLTSPISTVFNVSMILYLVSCNEAFQKKKEKKWKPKSDQWKIWRVKNSVFWLVKSDMPLACIKKLISIPEMSFVFDAVNLVILC